MRPRPIRTAVCVIVALIAMASLASAGIHDVSRHGSCSGRGEWKLRAQQETSSTFRVTFTITRLDYGDTWQLFLSDNGTRILSVSRVVGEYGRVRAVTVTSDLAGNDRIKASGVNVSESGSCDGALTYRA